MNNKYTKYFLIVAVIGIWGAILYRVVQGLSSTSPAPPSENARPISELKPVSDTFRLNADYPDPFLAAADSIAGDTLIRKNDALAANPTQTPAAIGVPPAEPVANVIQFNGIMANSQNKTRVAIVTIRGKEMMVKGGEKIDEVYIKRIRKDGLNIIYKGKAYFLQ